jgi:YfiR/HmsC-like
VTKRIAKAEGAIGCRILFVSGVADLELTRVLQTVEKAGVLTVSDMPQFVERGGMIQFVSQGNKVRFIVNVPAAEQAGLVLSSELLRVAVAVQATKRGA